MSGKRASLVLAALVLTSVLFASQASACAVCYGDVDSSLTKGMNNGILVLLGIIASVQVGFVALFLAIRRRARQIDRHKASFELIQGGAG